VTWALVSEAVAEVKSCSGDFELLGAKEMEEKPENARLTQQK
jgi:hypothetical protein